MKKIQWTGVDKLEILQDDIIYPLIRNPHEVRIRITVAGFCSTDVHVIQGKVRFVDPPLVLGHEFAGVVEECGSAVTRVRPGDRVKCDSVRGCGVCEWCVRGATQFCLSGSEFGVTCDGGWCERLVVPERNLYRLPDSIADDVAAIMDVEMLSALRKPGIREGETVAVFGPGPAGLIALQAARIMGAGSVILCGPQGNRLQLGKELGADWVVDIGEQNPVEAIREITKGRGADVVVDAAGTTRAALDALEAARPQGRVVLYGVHGAPASSFPLDRIVLKDLVVYGALSDRVGWEELIAMVAAKRIDLGRLITHALPIECAREAYAVSSTQGSGCIKATLLIAPEHLSGKFTPWTAATQPLALKEFQPSASR